MNLLGLIEYKEGLILTLITEISNSAKVTEGSRSFHSRRFLLRKCSINGSLTAIVIIYLCSPTCDSVYELLIRFVFT